MTMAIERKRNEPDKNITKEIERLVKHYKNEIQNELEGTMYSYGVVDGLEMALDILEHRNFYDKKKK